MESIKLIKQLVELREIDGGIMDPGMVPFVPHREPAADTANPGIPDEPTEVDLLYKMAVKARLATEDLVKALENPIYDEPYEHAFKATMSLRDALNALIGEGAQPIRKDHIVAPIPSEQPVGSSVGVTHMPMVYTGDTLSEQKRGK
jgi:hypothetical protein